MFSTSRVIALIGPAYILFFFCYIQCHKIQYIPHIPPRVSEAQLPWVLVRQHHLHNSWIYTGTVQLLLWGDGSPHLNIHYTTMVITVPLAWSHLNNGMSFDELPHLTINFCSLCKKINNFTICNGTFLSNSFLAIVQWLTLSNAFSCIKKAHVYSCVLIKKKIYCLL